MVAKALRQAAVQRCDCRQAAGVRQHLPADLAALGAVASEQRLRVREAAANERQLPGEVDRVLHPGVHSLPAGGAVDMGGVAGEEHPLGPIVGHLALVDRERGKPDRRGGRDAAGPPLIDERLHLIERRFARALARLDVRNHAIASGGDRKQQQHAIRMPIDLELVRRREAGEVKVGEDPVGNKRIALELHAKPVTHGAVRAIATDHPLDIERFLAPVGRRRKAVTASSSATNRVNSTCRSTCTPSEFRCSSISRSVSLCGSISA